MTTFPDRMGSDGISGGMGDASGPGSCASHEAASASSPSASIPCAAAAERVSVFAIRHVREHYTSRNERVALRCALGDAAHLCDAIARDILKENRGRGGKGVTTKHGVDLCVVAKRCGDAIWAMRDLIDVAAAQGIEAGTAETQRGSVEDESPIPEGNAP